jgi:hypothetical protein
MVSPHLQLSIGPSWDFNNHIQHRLLLVGIQGDIVERRQWLPIFLDKGTELECVGGADLAQAEFGGLLAVGHVGGGRLCSGSEVTGEKLGAS